MEASGAVAASDQLETAEMVSLGYLALEELVRLNEGLVRATVGKCSPGDPNEADTQQEARYAITRAAGDYDPDQGASVATWIVWKIRGVCDPASRDRRSMGRGRVDLVALDSLYPDGHPDGERGYRDGPASDADVEDAELGRELSRRIAALRSQLRPDHAQHLIELQENLAGGGSVPAQRWRSVRTRSLVMHPSAGVLDDVTAEHAIARANWRSDAACRGAVTGDFFPERGRSVSQPVSERCAGCPVVDDCRSVAIALNYDRGFWGGHTPVERRKARKSLVFMGDEQGLDVRPPSVTPTFHVVDEGVE